MIQIKILATNQDNILKDLSILSGLNPRGALDFSPLYIISKGLIIWQLKLQC